MVFDQPAGNRLTGFYRGKVIQHLTHGYCKIFIPSVHPEEWEKKPEYLPPAEQAASLFAGTNTGSGVFTYPNIGSIVWCFFSNEDQNLPVYFAATLGGENAFGQHEIVKLPTEKVSKRHLITSGKTQIEWYENGKLSVQVEDPDRRDSLVDYRNSYIGLISDDVVSARPIVEKVDSEELSNIYCKLVFDNDNNVFGSTFLQTHHYDVNGNTKLTNDNNISVLNSGIISFETLSTYNNGQIDKTNNAITMAVGSGNAIQQKSTFDSASMKQNNSSIHDTITNGDAAWNFNIVGKSEKVDCQIEQKSSTYKGTSKYRINDNTNSTESYIDIETTTGDLQININDKSSGHSYIIMTKAGVLTIDTTDKVVIHAPNEIQLTSDAKININAGSEINMTAPTINGTGDSVINLKAPTINGDGSSAVNINGGGGDVVIAGTSLENHTHPYVDSGGWIGNGTTKKPDP